MTGTGRRVHTRGGIPLLTLPVEDDIKGMLCMEFASKGAHTPMLCVGGNSPTLALIDLIAQRVVVTAGTLSFVASPLAMSRRRVPSPHPVAASPRHVPSPCRPSPLRIASAAPTRGASAPPDDPRGCGCI